MLIRQFEMSADSGDAILTYWLMPIESARGYFASVIKNLAARFDAPVFEPHVTVYVTKATSENSTDILTRALGEAKTYRLSIVGIDSSDEFTKTLFVQFRPNEALARLSANLRAASVSQDEYQLNPHLSLIYKKMSAETKAEIKNSLHIPFSQVEFDSVKAVISPAQIESREDVEAWRVVAEKKLAE